MWSKGEGPHIRRETTIAPPDSDSVLHSTAVERWFVELRDPIFRYLRTSGCSCDLAEEITQETFLRLQRTLREEAVLNDVRAWLFRVARNLWIDSKRDNRRYGPTLDGNHSADLECRDSEPDPEQQLIHRERIRLMDQAIARLPKLQRECVRLKAQGLRYHEIADALGISMTAAVDCVRRALKRLGGQFHD